MSTNGNNALRIDQANPLGKLDALLARTKAASSRIGKVVDQAAPVEAVQAENPVLGDREAEESYAATMQLLRGHRADDAPAASHTLDADRVAALLDFEL